MFENFEKLNCQLSVTVRVIRLVSYKMADTPTFRTHMAARGWVSRVSSKLDNLCQDANVNLIELSDAIAEFDIRINRLDDTQTAVELEIDMVMGDIGAISKAISTTRLLSETECESHGYTQPRYWLRV